MTGTTVISRDVEPTPGDTLLSIARRELGSAAFAHPLAEFNELELELEIDAPLAAGQLVRVPIRVPARGETAARRVRQGRGHALRTCRSSATR